MIEKAKKELDATQQRRRAAEAEAQQEAELLLMQMVMEEESIAADQAIESMASFFQPPASLP